jgi:hypothetical protein
VRNIFWTEQSRSDLAAIHAFIAANPESYDGGRGAGENSDDETATKNKGRSYSTLGNSPMPLT